jgi:hypothetical protein
MNVVIIFAGLAIVLFTAAFVTRRRFGLLGLALATGSILSSLWGFDAGLVVSSMGIFPSGSLTNAVTLSLIVLLPSILLLLHGHTYKDLISRAIGSLMFALLALAFLVQPLGGVLPLDGIGMNVYTWLVQYKDVIISVGLILAVVDLFFTKSAVPLREHKSKR